MRSVTLKILQLLAVSLLSLLLLNKINIFSFLSFVPEDYVLDVGITVYFTVFGLIFDQLIVFIKNKWLSELTAIISVRGAVQSIESVPKICFNKEGLAEADLTIQVYGKKERFVNVQLFIPVYQCMTMQVSPKHREAFIDSEGNLVVNLDAMFSGGKEKYRNEITIHISFIKEVDFSKRDLELKPVLRTKTKDKSPFWIQYNYNTSRLIEKE